MPTATILHTPVEEPDRFLPEGPRSLRWQGRDALVWVNIQTAADSTTGNLFLRCWESGEVLRWELPGRPGFVVPTSRDAVVILGLTKEVGEYDLNQRTWTPLARIPDEHPRTIINDGEAISEDAIIFGTKDTQFAQPIADLYLFQRQPIPRIVRLRDQQLCSNGKVIHDTPEGLIVYDIDTPSKVITRNRLDLEVGTLTWLGVAVDLRGEADYPDGMIDGGENSVIVAFYNPEAVPAGRAVRYDLTTGQAVQSWQLPRSPRVTCPLLVERPEGRRLIFTTAVEGMPAELRANCPAAGCLFIAEV